MDEVKNPFVNAKVVRTGVDTETYLQQADGIGRGHPGYVQSRSDLAMLRECAWKWVHGWTFNGSDSTDWGDLIDCKYLTKDRFAKRYAVTPPSYDTTVMRCPACRSVGHSKSCRKCGVERKPVKITKPWNRTAQVCQDWELNAGDKTIISQEDNTQSDNAVKMLWGDPDCRELRECSQTQVMVVGEYRDKETGLVIPVKCLIDLLPASIHPRFGKCVADLKTSKNASPHAWDSDVFYRNYDMQAAMELWLYTAATGEDRNHFRHIVSESPPPWLCEMRLMSGQLLQIGQGKVIEALRLYCQCLKEGKWPKYAATAQAKGGEIIDGCLVEQAKPWMLGA